MPIDTKLIVPPAEYLPWIKKLVDDLNKDHVGGGVQHVRRFDWVGAFVLPDDFFVRFNSGSDGHSAKLLRDILDKGYSPIFMQYRLWPALLAQGQSDEE